MKSSELRIGNYISVKNMGVDLPAIIERGVEIDASNEFNPIPLSEEWILRAGFKHIHDDWYYNCILSVNISKKTAHVGNYCVNNIEFVHQLQNLYFALTSEELQILSLSTNYKIYISP